MLATLGSCLAVVMLIQDVRGYPTGAPPEGCRSMLPGHGVPPQTVTTNPYSINTDTSVFSCPGDEIRVTLRGDVFRGFLCEPIPNTGNFVQNPQDPIRKQNKCGHMAAFTHVDNSVKSSISFIWKPQTVQAVVIACTVVHTKNYFWVNITSPLLKYVKTNCSRATGEQEAPKQGGPTARRTPPGDVTNDVRDTSSPSDTGMDARPDKGGNDRIIDPEMTSLDINPENDVKSKVAVTRNDPEIGGKRNSDPDFQDNKDVDGKGEGHRTSGTTFLILCLSVCVMYF